METVLKSLALITDPHTLGVMLIAAIFGLFVGAIPGLTATMATALLIPFTFFMDPVPAIAAIVTTVATAIFAGDIPGALLRIPGTPASAAYCDESYAMTKKRIGRTRAGHRFGNVCHRRADGFNRAFHECAGARRIRYPVLILRIFLAGLSRSFLCCHHLHRLDVERFRLAVYRSVHRNCRY